LLISRFSPGYSGSGFSGESSQKHCSLSSPENSLCRRDYSPRWDAEINSAYSSLQFLPAAGGDFSQREKRR
jgi:hypothetical protein